MRFPRFSLLIMLLGGSLSGLVWGQSTPKVSSVEPGEGKAGMEITALGENLDRKGVAELYLTDGKNDVKVTILAQTGTSIKFRIPPDMKAGRFSLMIMTAGADPKLIEQPVRLTVQ